MAIYIGIDGGGSNLRVAAVDESLNVIAQMTRGAANPSGIGREASAALIQGAIREVLSLTPHPPAPSPTQSAWTQDIAVRGGETISAVGIGVAGASPVYADDWLRETVGTVLPGVPVATATDVEIALVGANGERKGVIVVAGTGSVAFGVNDVGESAQIGGWGYLLGDEGSGYWIGMEALRWITKLADRENFVPDILSRRVMAQIGVERPQDVIRWVYRQPPPVREIAELAGIVLEIAAEAAFRREQLSDLDTAEDEDGKALRIVRQGAKKLKNLTRTLKYRLNMIGNFRVLLSPEQLKEEHALLARQVAFGGGLLTSDNELSRQLCKELHLDARPEAMYPPVIGAALLAKITYG